MLLMEYLVTQPKGVVSAVLAGSPSDMPHWRAETALLRDQLPSDVVDLMRTCEAQQRWDLPAYRAAETLFNKRHMCRLTAWPECLERAMAKTDRNPQVYRTLNGPNEFHVIGAVRDWEIRSRLQGLGLPVLLTSGGHDEATPAQMQALKDRLPQARWVVFPQSSHTPHLEEPGPYLAVLADFLARADSR
jgi:L-proline amide hydrolase